MVAIKKLNTSDSNFQQDLEQLLAWEAVSDAAVENTVRTILADVRARGDAAVVEYTNRFDRTQAVTLAELEIPPQRLQQALDAIPALQREALERAAQRVRAYAEHQKMDSWSYTEADGTVLGQQVTALERVGLYVPGGKAAYPSSVLMNAVPAKVAGVAELIMVVPTPDGVINELVLAAAAVAGVDRVFAIGGAQAVAALAYGTESIPQVDKIVGPGNIYVATAKGMVFGAVGIDMIAGPSEILVVCDGDTDPDWIAMDLFSQAEHDEDAQAILICPDSAFLDACRLASTNCCPPWNGTRSSQPRYAIAAPSSRCAIWMRRPTWPISSRRNIWSCRWPIPSPWRTRSVMPVPSSWAAIRPRPWVITVPDPTTCCPRHARRASRRPWACTISRSVPA